MSNPKERAKKLNSKFLEYWSKKREKKLQFTIKNTTLFALPLSIVLGVTNYGWSRLLSFENMVLTILTFSIYGCFVYFIEFKINEKRYQKLLREKQSFDT